MTIREYWEAYDALDNPIDVTVGSYQCDRTLTQALNRMELRLRGVLLISVIVLQVRTINSFWRFNYNAKYRIKYGLCCINIKRYSGSLEYILD